MTEEEWLRSDDLFAMLQYLRGEVGPEEQKNLPFRMCSGKRDLWCGEAKWTTQSRLSRFALEVCQGWRQLPLDNASSKLLVEFESYLNGKGSHESVVAECRNLTADSTIPAMAFRWGPTPHGIYSLCQGLAWAVTCYRNRDRIDELNRNATEDERFAWGFFGYEFPEFNEVANEVRRPFPNLLREIVGNPFRPVALDPSWLSPDVVTLADAIYAERAFDRLPILADALEEADCDNQEVLDHCRGVGPHVRGCWVVDLLTGRK